MHTVTHTSLTNSHADPRSATAPVAGVVAWIGRAYRNWQQIHAERQALERLDERDLRDVGLTRYSVERELARPFWRG
jgi:uncharacterized protein YjiS (DUF1127 family)